MVGTGTSGVAALIGSFDAAEESAYRHALERASTDAFLSRTLAESRERLTRQRPKCIFIPGDSPELAETAAWVRQQPQFFATPVIALVSSPEDKVFVNAYLKGADDVVLRNDIGGMTRRVANLDEFDPALKPPMSQQGVLICHPDDNYRRLLGRVLRLAGFNPQFAADHDEMLEGIKSASPTLVVASDSVLAVNDVDWLRSSAQAEDVPVIVVTAKPSTRTTIDPTIEQVAMVSESAPPDHLLFLANNMLAADRARLRLSLIHI